MFQRELPDKRLKSVCLGLFLWVALFVGGTAGLSSSVKLVWHSTTLLDQASSATLPALRFVGVV